VKLTTPQGITIKAPDIIEPRDNQVFKAGTTILLRIKKLAPAPFTSFYFQLDEKLNADKEYRKASTTVVINKTYRQIMGTHTPDLLLLPGKYRVRAAYRDANKKEWTDTENLHWSDWRYFTVGPDLHLKIPTQIPKKSFNPNTGVSAAQPHQIKAIGKLGNKSINPQPEPPGKQIRKISMPLAVMPHPRTFRPAETINISVKNTPFSRLPFELRYRPAAGKPYRLVNNPNHSFSRTNGVTNLRFSLKKPGEYQVRFRTNHKAPWTNWSSFQVRENPDGAAALARKMRMSTAAAARAINPQPEPPGKIMNTHIGRHMPNGVTAIQNSPATVLGSPVAQGEIAPPKIRQPHNGEKFFLAGSSMHVKAKVEYGGKERLQVEVQQEKQRRFVAVHPQISLSKTGKIGTVDITLGETGNYRLRVRAGNSRHWGNWTTFKVDKLMSNMPALEQTTSALKGKASAKKPTLSIKPGLQPIR